MTTFECTPTATRHKARALVTIYPFASPHLDPNTATAPSHPSGGCMLPWTCIPCAHSYRIHQVPLPKTFSSLELRGARTALVRAVLSLASSPPQCDTAGTILLCPCDLQYTSSSRRMVMDVFILSDDVMSPHLISLIHRAVRPCSKRWYAIQPNHVDPTRTSQSVLQAGSAGSEA